MYVCERKYLAKFLRYFHINIEIYILKSINGQTVQTPKNKHNLFLEVPLIVKTLHHTKRFIPLSCSSSYRCHDQRERIEKLSAGDNDKSEKERKSGVPLESFDNGVSRPCEHRFSWSACLMRFPFKIDLLRAGVPLRLVTHSSPFLTCDSALVFLHEDFRAT